MSRAACQDDKVDARSDADTAADFAPLSNSMRGDEPGHAGLDACRIDVSVRSDNRLRSALSCGAFVGVHSEGKNSGQRVRRCDIDYVVGFGKMKVVGTREQFAQCGFMSSRKSEVCYGLGLDCMQQPPGQGNAFINIPPRDLTRDALEVTYSTGKLPSA